MRRWFLSYHSPDQALAERLKAALERKDTDARVFFAPSSLRAGGFWSRALAEEIAQADAFILLVGEKGVGDWQVLEYDEALDKRVKFPDFPVILVLLEGQTAPGLPFLRRLHWIITPDPSSEKDVARLFDAACRQWHKVGRAVALHVTLPRPCRDGGEGQRLLFRPGARKRLMCSLRSPPRRTGSQFCSAIRASANPRLHRRACWRRSSAKHGPRGQTRRPQWPQAFQESRRWCFLTLKPGTEPLKALVESFLDTWQLGATDPERVKQQNGWIELLRDGKAMLRDLLDATERRYKELDRTKPPAFLLYVDQGEELYVRAEERQRRRFSEVIAQGVADPRLYMLMSMRTDFLGELQKDEPLFKVHRQIDVPPLREAELREVVSRPAELLSARFETAGLVDIITRRTAEDSVKDVGALPLLSYTLDDMWTQMVKRGDGVLRLPAQSFELGGVLVDRADAFLAAHPKSQDELRRIFTLKLATVREGEEPTRRRALRSEFTDEEWRLVSELADHPNRLLVTATPEGGRDLCRGGARGDLPALGQAARLDCCRARVSRLENWARSGSPRLAGNAGRFEERRAADGRGPDAGAKLAVQSAGRICLSSIGISSIRAQSARARQSAGAARAGSRLRAVGRYHHWAYWLDQSVVPEGAVELVHGRAAVHENTGSALRARRGGRASAEAGGFFRECAKDCPEMVVVPAGDFMMGSPPNEKGRYDNEGPQHKVTIAKPLPFPSSR